MSMSVVFRVGQLGGYRLSNDVISIHFMFHTGIYIFFVTCIASLREFHYIQCYHEIQ